MRVGYFPCRWRISILGTVGDKCICPRSGGPASICSYEILVLLFLAAMFLGISVILMTLYSTRSYAPVAEELHSGNSA
jgi:hypothetical protein